MAKKITFYYLFDTKERISVFQHHLDYCIKKIDGSKQEWRLIDYCGNS